MCNNAWSVLNQKLIVGTLNFIFSTNDLKMSVCVFLVETPDAYIPYDFES